jgi:seryl-tRNA synthetase
MKTGITSNKNLLKLAKPKTDNKPVKKEEVKVSKAAVTKPVIKTVAKPVVIDAEHERQKKAIDMVEDLLADIDVKVVKETSINTPDESKIINKSNDNKLWLEEQVARLTEESEQLRAQLAGLPNAPQPVVNSDGITYNDYNVSDDSDGLKQKTIELFSELQDMHQRWGVNFKIYPVGFMNRLIEIFPYLKDYKTFSDM